MPDRRNLLLGLVASAIPVACGFTPVHAPGTGAEALRGLVRVAQVDGLMGYELRRRLTERLGAPTRAFHELRVTLDVSPEGLAISEENEITRYNVTGTAEFALITGDRVVLRDKVRAFAAYSATASPFAGRVAERDARARLARSLADQIATRLFVSAQRWAT